MINISCKDIKEGINVTVIPYKKVDISVDELNDHEFMIANKNRILEFVDNYKWDGDKSKRVNSTRQEIIKQFGGVVFKVKSLKLLRSRKEIKPLIKSLQTEDSDIRLIAVYVELKWVRERHKLSLRPRRNEEKEQSVLLTLFISYQAKTDDTKNNEKSDENDENQNDEEDKQDMSQGLVLKCCLLTSRDVWVTENYCTPNFKQLYYECLHFNQFWLHFVPEIIDYWCAKYSVNGQVYHLPLLLPAKLITFFWQKQFKIYEDMKENDSDNYLEYIRRKHYVLTCELSVSDDHSRTNQYLQSEEPDAYIVEEAQEEWVDTGVESIDGIFSMKNVKDIMKDMSEYLKTKDIIHFALAYKYHESERKIINDKYNNLLSMHSKYIHKPETYELYKGEMKELYTETETDSESERSDDADYVLGIAGYDDTIGFIQNPYVDTKLMKKQKMYSRELNNEFIKKHTVNPMNINEIPVDQVNHIPIPKHFQNQMLQNPNLINDETIMDNNKIVLKKKSRKKKQNKNDKNKFVEFPKKTCNYGILNYAYEIDMYPINSSKNKYLQSLKVNTEQYWKENVKRTVYKSKQILKQMREMNQTKLIINNLNGRAVRLYIHEHPEKLAINITNTLPEFWSKIIKPILLRFGMKKIAKYYQFAFVFESVQNSNSFIIDFASLQCGETLLHFQNSELTLMLFCIESCVIYSDNLALTIVPGRIYIFDYDSFHDEYITIFNNKQKCFVLMLRTSPCINNSEKSYCWFNVNKIYDCFEPIEFNQIYKHTQKYNDGFASDMDGFNDLNSEYDPNEYELKESEEIQEINSNKKKHKIVKKIYSARLMSQKLDNCIELKMDSKDFVNEKKLKKIYNYKKLMNKILNLDNRNEKQKYFGKLIKKVDAIRGEIYFYIGNDFEIICKYSEAIKFYQSSIDENKKYNAYISTKTVYHLYNCKKLSKTIFEFGKIDNYLFQLLEESWKNACLNDDKYKEIRRNWVIYGDVQEQLLGASGCALQLAQYNQELQWNDTSLIWYKRAFNILEQLRLIYLCNVGINEIIDSANVNRPIISLKEEEEYINMNMNIERKRIFVHWSPNKDINIAERIIQNYMQCIVERFLGNKYTKNIKDISTYKCFKDFQGNKNKYYSNFDKYLQTELDCTFEISLHYFEYPISQIHSNNIQIANVYNNYATFLKDVLKRYESAEILYEIALKYNQTDAIIYWNLAEIYKGKLMWDKAKQYYNQTLRITPTIPIEEYEKTKKNVENAIKSIDQKKPYRIFRV